MQFDWYLRVLQDRFNLKSDSHSLSIEYENMTVDFQKINEFKIRIASDALEVYIASSHWISDAVAAEFFEEHINLTSLHRVVILDEIQEHTPASSDLATICELLLTYYHIILIDNSKYRAYTPELEKAAMYLEDVQIGDKRYSVYCDAGAII